MTTHQWVVGHDEDRPPEEPLLHLGGKRLQPRVEIFKNRFSITWKVSPARSKWNPLLEPSSSHHRANAAAPCPPSLSCIMYLRSNMLIRWTGQKSIKEKSTCRRGEAAPPAERQPARPPPAPPGEEDLNDDSEVGKKVCPPGCPSQHQTDGR